jgi:hypothetical protein
MVFEKMRRDQITVRKNGTVMQRRSGRELP